LIVAGTNLIAYLLVPGERTPRAEIVMERDSEWVVPPLWRSEFRSVLVLCIRRGALSLEQATQTAERAEALLKGKEFPVPSAQVLALAAGSGCSAYDCEFVALAQQLGARLVTSDRGILAKFPAMTVSLESFVR
jgi:predicted nucleic acid-binding protein